MRRLSYFAVTIYQQFGQKIHLLVLLGMKECHRPKLLEQCQEIEEALPDLTIDFANLRQIQEKIYSTNICSLFFEIILSAMDSLPSHSTHMRLHQKLRNLALHHHDALLLENLIDVACDEFIQPMHIL